MLSADTPWVHNFDGDVPRQLWVIRRVHGAHAAAGNDVENHIPTDTRSGPKPVRRGTVSPIVIVEKQLCHHLSALAAGIEVGQHLGCKRARPGSIQELGDIIL